MKTNMETFRKRFRELRVEKGLTQEQLAEAVGYAVETIQRIESGYVKEKFRNVLVEELVNFAKCFSVSLSYLCGQTNCKIAYMDKSCEKIEFDVERLKKLRKNKWLTQASLSKELGFEKSVIYKIEKGKRCIYVGELIIISDYFQVNISYLCGQTDRSFLEVEASMEETAILQIMDILKNYDKNIQEDILEKTSKRIS